MPVPKKVQVDLKKSHLESILETMPKKKKPSLYRRVFTEDGAWMLLILISLILTITCIGYGVWRYL